MPSGHEEAKNESKKSRVPEGASALLGMFEPPEGAESSSGNNNNDKETNNRNSKIDGSHSSSNADQSSTLPQRPLSATAPTPVQGNIDSKKSAPPSPLPPPPSKASQGPNGRPPPPLPGAITNDNSSNIDGSGSGGHKRRSSAAEIAALGTTPPQATPLLNMFEPPKSGEEEEERGYNAITGVVLSPERQTSRTTIGAQVVETSSPPGAAHLLSMFQQPSSSSLRPPPPPPPPPPLHQHPDQQNDETTILENDNLASTPSLPPEAALRPDDRQSTVRYDNTSEQTSLLKSLFEDDGNDGEPTPQTKSSSTVQRNPQYYNATSNYNDEDDDNNNKISLGVLLDPARREERDFQHHHYYHCHPWRQTINQWIRNHYVQPSTIAGACMFLLYHVVFCLANGSAIVRPSSPDTPVLGEMAKWTTVGILFGGPFYIYRLGKDVPAVYPSVDLFLAPFLASAAAVVDQTLVDDDITSNSVFLATFAVLASIGMFLSGSLLLLAAKFKLANLGTFLPYSVLCGFFSAVGVLLWALAFSVDNSGHTWQRVFFSGDWNLVGQSLLHHLPSLSVGILMNKLGPKHPFYVVLLIVLTMIGSYVLMWITGTSLAEAQEQKWFWSRQELIIQPAENGGGMFSEWVPPVPLGHIGALMQGLVHWKAVYAGLSDMFALAFLYLLRSSIHSSAMKKNVNNLVCKTRVKTSNPSPANDKKTTDETSSYARAAVDTFSDRMGDVYESLEGSQAASGVTTSVRNQWQLRRHETPHLDIEMSTDVIDGGHAVADSKRQSGGYEYIETRPKPCRKSLQGIFTEYGLGLWLVACSGGFGLCPTVATSNTMYAIGAGGPAPQYGSVLLLIIFYLTDFALVRYIPKACFSSLLVLGAVDTFVVWFFLSFRKTQDILEWLVVPFIVLFSLVVGFLNAVFLGIGISTFVFVASFFRVGVVKFNATGLEIRSTIERSSAISDWLDANGDLIQVICLQNYLMFMNASSVLSYIETMFEDVEDMGSLDDTVYIPPSPKILIIDMSLNTGMDTSTVDIFAEIKELCKNNGCKLFLCGLSSRTKKGLGLAGVKPEPGLRDKRLVRFFPTLDTALGKAEDLITFELYEKDKDSRPTRLKGLPSTEESGFRVALKEIDEQHGQEFSLGLFDLEPYTVPIELRAGEHLFASDGGQVLDSERGLFFIESGMLKIERDAGHSLTRGRNTVSRTRGAYNTLNNLHARKGTVGKQLGALKATPREPTTQTFRLARIGPGWVCGAIEGASGLKHAGVYVAVSNCRLHHVPFQKLKAIEDQDPILILRLYKMLSHLMARRQEITIEQLATFHSIMSSPAHSKPLSRAAIMALRR